MIKQEIIDRLAKKHRLNRRYSKELVDSVFELLEEGMKRDGKVTITRFGTFYIKVYKPKLGRNFRSGKLFQTKETPVAKFHASTQMSGRIKKNYEVGQCEKEDRGDHPDPGIASSDRSGSVAAETGTEKR